MHCDRGKRVDEWSRSLQNRVRGGISTRCRYQSQFADTNPIAMTNQNGGTENTSHRQAACTGVYEATTGRCWPSKSDGRAKVITANPIKIIAILTHCEIVSCVPNWPSSSCRISSIRNRPIEYKINISPNTSPSRVRTVQ